MDEVWKAVGFWQKMTAVPSCHQLVYLSDMICRSLTLTLAAIAVEPRPMKRDRSLSSLLFRSCSFCSDDKYLYRYEHGRKSRVAGSRLSLLTRRNLEFIINNCRQFPSFMVGTVLFSFECKTLLFLVKLWPRCAPWKNRIPIVLDPPLHTLN